MLKGRNKVAVGALVMLLVIAFAVVRYFERILFYDPFLEYFHGEFQQQPLPEFDGFILGTGLFFRYSLNTFISLGLIYVLFRSMSKVRFAAALYAIFFVVLALAFYITVFFFEDHVLSLFYIRRFLIQPLFVILFIPAFYYQDRQSASQKQ